MEFIRSNGVLGLVKLRECSGDDGWREVMRDDVGMAWRVDFAQEGVALRWEIVVTNTGAAALEIDDLELPLPMTHG